MIVDVVIILAAVYVIFELTRMSTLCQEMRDDIDDLLKAKHNHDAQP
jgi:hypothetical protein